MLRGIDFGLTVAYIGDSMRRIVVATIGIAVLALVTALDQAANREVRMVLQITVDQLRGDREAS